MTDLIDKILIGIFISSLGIGFMFMGLFFILVSNMNIEIIFYGFIFLIFGIWTTYYFIYTLINYYLDEIKL